MKKKGLRAIVFLVISLLSFTYTIKWLNDVNLSFDKSITEKIINSSNNINDNNTVFEEVIDYIIKLDVFNPIDLLNNNYIGLVDAKEIKKDVPIFVSKGSGYRSINNLIEEPSNSLGKPLVYIYNTHFEEKYARNGKVDVTVRDASNILKEKLAVYKIDSIVEKTNTQDILRTNNWSYGYSYVVSRMLLEEAFKDNKSLEYYIDVHRDSVSKSISTVSIKDKSYARVMFLVGLDNKNYKANREVMAKLNGMLEAEYPGISRGLYEKQGASVNGIYNQDFSRNCILIEVGGEHNTIEEITNTLEAFSKIFNDYLGGTNG